MLAEAATDEAQAASMTQEEIGALPRVRQKMVAPPFLPEHEQQARFRRERCRRSAIGSKADPIQSGRSGPFVAEAVEKLRSGKRRRNKGIDGPTSANHCCAVWPAGESMLRRGPLKIVFQQPQP